MLQKQNVVFGFNRENKMQNPKIVQKRSEIKMPRKHLTFKVFLLHHDSQ